MEHVSTTLMKHFSHVIFQMEEKHCFLIKYGKWFVLGDKQPRDSKCEPFFMHLITFSKDYNIVNDRLFCMKIPGQPSFARVFFCAKSLFHRNKSYKDKLFKQNVTLIQNLIQIVSSRFHISRVDIIIVHL